MTTNESPMTYTSTPADSGSSSSGFSSDAPSDKKEAATPARPLESWERFNLCCDSCMKYLGYCCILSAVFIVLMAFPIAEVVQLVIHWNDQGECPVSFRWLILFKLLITMFLYMTCLIHFKFELVSKPLIVILSMVSLFMWCIMASIEVLDDRDHDECNAHHQHTAGYYDFMIIELMTVYVALALAICFVSWFMMATERAMKIFTVGVLSSFFISLVVAWPMMEIVVLGVFWNDHGKCPDDFQWFILSKLVATTLLWITGGTLYRYGQFGKMWVKISFGAIVGVLLMGWTVSAAVMFWDPDHFDHDDCNAHSGHTAIYYDFMFIEISCSVAVTALSSSAVFWATSFRFVCPGGIAF